MLREFLASKYTVVDIEKKKIGILLPAEFYCMLQQLKPEMSDDIRLILCSKNHPTLSAYWRRFFELFT